MRVSKGTAKRERARLGFSFRDVGSHSHKVQMPRGMDEFVKAVLRLIFPTIPSTAYHVEVENEPLHRGPILFRPVRIARNAVQVEVQTPNIQGDQEPKRCCNFDFRDLEVGEAFQAMSIFCNQNPITSENWGILLEKGFVPNAAADTWIPRVMELCQKIEMMSQAQTQFGSTFSFITYSQLLQLMRRMLPPEEHPRNQRGWDKQITFLTDECWLMYNSHNRLGGIEHKSIFATGRRYKLEIAKCMGAIPVEAKGDEAWSLLDKWFQDTQATNQMAFELSAKATDLSSLEERLHLAMARAEKEEELSRKHWERDKKKLDEARCLLEANLTLQLSVLDELNALRGIRADIMPALSLTASTSDPMVEDIRQEIQINLAKLREVSTAS